MKENNITAAYGSKRDADDEQPASQAPATAADVGAAALPTTQQELLAKGVVRENAVSESAVRELSRTEQDLLAKGVARNSTARDVSVGEQGLLPKGLVASTPTKISATRLAATEQELFAKGIVTQGGPFSFVSNVEEDLIAKGVVRESVAQTPMATNDKYFVRDAVQAPSALTDLEQKMVAGKQMVQAPSALTQVTPGKETTNIGMGIPDHIAVLPLPVSPGSARQPERSIPGAHATPGAYALSLVANGRSRNQTSNGTFNTTAADTEQPAIPRAETEENGLAVANPVDDNSERNARLDLPRAVTEEQERQENLRKKRRSAKRQAVQMVLFGLCLVLVIVIPIVLLQKDTISEPVASATSPANSSAENVSDVPSLTPDEATLRALLPAYTLDKIVNESASPQAQAYRWILQDPILRIEGLGWRVKQRFALATAFFATDGDNWKANTNWLDHDTHECMWWSQISYKDVSQFDDHNPMENAAGTCEFLEGQDTVQYKQVYSHLWLSENNLNGTIPPELFWLTSLRSLSLRENRNLIGSIPTHIGMPKELEGVSFAFTQVTGVLPSEIGALSALHSFSAPAAQLTGSLPSELGLLTQLIELFLDNNALSGELPAELGKLTNLLWLFLNDNFFAGVFPEWILSLTKLDEFTLYANEMNGTIPTGIGQLTDLQRLWLYSNHFSGVIPSEIGLLTNLFALYLDDNRLTGTLPMELGQLVNICDFWTSWNSHTGTIPSEIGMCSLMYHLELGNNNLSGNIPTELGLLPNDWSLIPKEKFYIAPGTQMLLALQENQLSGPIPSELGKRESLGFLYLQDNYLSGWIPSELGAINNMTYLQLDSNNLSGEIPIELLEMPNLAHLNVSINPLLSGELPDTFCESLHLECSDILCGCGCPCHNTSIIISDDFQAGDENITATNEAGNSNQTSG